MADRDLLLKMNVQELFRRYPFIGEVFEDYGLKCRGCPFAEKVSLEEALASSALSSEEITREIVRSLEYKFQMRQEESLLENRGEFMKETVLLGDSITQWNPIRDRRIVNLGVEGDTTEDILRRIQEVEVANCRKVIFCAGINDILNKFSLEKSCELYRKIIEVLQRNFQEVSLISVLPIENRRRINMKVRRLNEHIQDIAVGSKVDYLDIHPLFCNGDLNLREEYSTDGIHLSPKGYDILNREIAKLL